MTFRKAMRVALPAPMLFAVTGGVLLTLDLDRAELASRSSPRVGSPVDAVPSRAEVLVARHGCWTKAEEMPADMVGVIPGHAVVITAKGRIRYSAGQVGPALEQLAYDGVIPGQGVDHGITVAGFCR